jgi:NCS1 family nucleobase:cation symporter-1
MSEQSVLVRSSGPESRQSGRYDEIPVAAHELKGLSHYLGLFAGEHVAGTEFAVGAVFVTWGVSTKEFLLGLLIGNLTAVLLWTFFPAMLGVETRQTLYAYLRRVCGPDMQRIFNIVCGIIYCTMGGVMMTISASAVRILFGISPQVGLYPTDIKFVILVLAIGAVVTVVAAYGFDGVSLFSAVCAPWLLSVFIMGGLLSMPELLKLSGIGSVESLGDFMALCDGYIWMPTIGGLTKWHVAAFAVFCNLSLHMGLNDMAIFRYAKKYQYGYSVSVGMFFGHFLAWIFSCMMGTAAAGLLNTDIRNLDTGDISHSVMGAVGLLAVVIAGWTTSNPNVYRSGLAFQNVFNKAPVRKVTLITGAITTVIACFPFIFSKLNEYVNIIGLAVTPVGAVVMCEHWLIPKLGMTRYWSYYRGEKLNKAAAAAWAGGLIITAALGVTGAVDFFFLFIPCFIVSCVIYMTAAVLLGARERYPEREAESNRVSDTVQKMREAPAGGPETVKSLDNRLLSLLLIVSIIALVVCLGMALLVFNGAMDGAVYRNYAILPTIVYFIFASLYMRIKKSSSIKKAPY